MIKALMAEKLGMTQLFLDDRAIPVTVLRAGPCHISQVKTPERDGYSAVQLSFSEAKPNQVRNPAAGHFAKAGVPAARHVAEVRVDDTSEMEAGTEITLGQVFAAGMVADVTGVTKGKGFSGVMKRHNFKGQLASHGVHRVHRAPGSIGAASTPARVFKGMPMAGRLGNDRQTVLNLDVVAVDLEEGLIMLNGPVPGRSGSVVMLRHAVKKAEQEVPEIVVEEVADADEAPEADAAEEVEAAEPETADEAEDAEPESADEAEDAGTEEKPSDDAQPEASEEPAADEEEGNADG